jgi:hypothetical protein
MEMRKVVKATSDSLLADKGDEKEALKNERPALEHETSRLIRTLTGRVKQVVTLIIIVVMLVACVAGLVTSLFKHSQTGTTLEESLKLLSAINNLHHFPGVLGAITSNNNATWNATSC